MFSKKMKNTITGALIISAITMFPATSYAASQPSTKRLEGLSRIDTSLAIAKEYNNSSVQNVILTTATDFPDALSGSVLAQKLNAPILLVDSNSRNIDVLKYIKDNLTASGTVYILGGTGVVSDSVIDPIKAMGIKNFVRLDGINRIDTNLKIVSSLNVATGTPIVIATGSDFPDALSVSSVAAAKGYPILLSDKDSISEKTLDTIKTINPSKIYVIGGTGVITGNVENQLKDYSSNVVRIYGANRYDTSLAIANEFKSTSTSNAIIATGSNFPDALSGSVLGSKLTAPILLVDSNDASKQKSFIDANSNITNLYILGGKGAVSLKIENQLKGIVTPPTPNIPTKPIIEPDNPTYNTNLPTSEPTLEYMLTQSTEATKEYTLNGTVEEALDPKKVPFDGNWYHWRVSEILYTGGTMVTDYFIKVLKVETLPNGKIARDVYQIDYVDGKGTYPYRNKYDQIVMN